MSTQTTCRSCGAGDLVEILDLGRTPLANALLTPAQLAEPEPVYPLVLVLCPHCTLVQITETVPPEKLFAEYFYFSSFSDAFVRHAKAIADRLITTRHLGPDSLVVEVASNDGYLLQHYRDRGIPVLGIEPARNIAALANERGIPTRNEFFSRAVAERLVAEGRRADVLHANNVIAHVADLHGVLDGVATLLAPGGVAVVESPYVKDMLDNVEFDTIYHEHLCYYSLSSMAELAARHHLVVTHVEHLDVHGGSLRYYLANDGVPSADVLALLAAEKAWGVTEPAAYMGFGARVEQVREQLTALIAGLKREGKRLAAYGASAKGAILLNTFGIGPAEIDYVVDRSTVKQGHFMPGTHLPIFPVERLREDMPDAVLLLAWNFADEILAQQAAYRAAGGRFIVPVPSPHFV